MKICTITLHCTVNCGSSLQAYALQRYLLDNGYETELVDYCPNYLKYNGNFLKSVVKNILYFRMVMSQKRKNEEFRRQYLILSERKYHSYRKLKKNPPNADVYIAGSDQIWNPDYECGRDPAYYLTFVEEYIPKLSYAASLGKEYIPDSQKTFILEKVRNFSYITVREESSKTFLEKEVSCPVDYVCDPVLLLTQGEYKKIQIKPQIKEKYILVYLVQESELLDKLVRELRKKLKAKVILIYGVRDYCQCDYHVKDVSPTEFLGYINNAEFIVASSFHATVFAHIFEKQFAVVLPRANTARIEQMLSVSRLQDRIIRKETDIINVFSDIDYGKVRPRLNEFIHHSKKVINCMLEKVNECL